LFSRRNFWETKNPPVAKITSVEDPLLFIVKEKEKHGNTQLSNLFPSTASFNAHLQRKP
jgi:hypothetical protein